MKKISDLGLTGKKLLIQGSILLIVGLTLIVTGVWLPMLAIRLALYGIFFLSLFELVMHLLKKSKSSESILVLIGKTLLFAFLAGADLAVQLPIYLMAIFIGFYQLLTAVVNVITYILYRKDGVRPRIRFLMDGIWLLAIAVLSLFSTQAHLTLQAGLVGAYLVLYGLTNIRDGYFFEQALEKQNLRRHIRIPLPLFLAALLPRVTLQRLNDFLAVHEEGTAADAYNRFKQVASEPVLEVFVHVKESGFEAVGHVDLNYKGTVYGYGSYDIASGRLGGSIGDGVLFQVERNAYIDFCNREGMTMLAYQIQLDEEQQVAIEERLEELHQLLLDWQPSAEPLVKGADGGLQANYTYRMQAATGARFYKFKKSKFKTYFVLSTNCVLLADWVVGQAGTDILGIRGFIAPGTYQHYLDEEYEKPHSMVVAKKVYYRT